MKIKSNDEIELLRIAGEMVGKVHNMLEPMIKPGVTTKELDEAAKEMIKDFDAVPSFKNFNSYPANICTSINEEVVHGIPSNRKLVDGDIISIDIGVCYKGYHGDSAWTYPVGEVNEETLKLMEVTQESLFAGLDTIHDGSHVGDIGDAISTHVKKHKYGVVKELVGHGVGRELHEKPDVPNYGKASTGPVLKEGMVIAVEPMINMSSPNIFILEDDWTIVTADELPSAHYEHTVLVTKDGYEILTKR